MKKKGEIYKENTNRDYRIKIIIVTTEEELVKLKHKIQQYDFQTNNPLFDLELFTENSLPQ